jgi:lipoate-protein ligase A
VSAAWRLLLDPPGSGAWNMSVDEALLLHVGSAAPTLRFYRWHRPTVSLGYRQKDPAWLERARRLGLEVVRRVSGGGAVLHAGDLTYAVVAPADCADLPPDLPGSYAWIGAALLDGLRRAGLDAVPAPGLAEAGRLSVCFAGSMGLEIELQGRKLVGSAQRRTREGLLQHGSIRLVDDSSWYKALFSDATPPPPALASVPPKDLVPKLAEAFSDALQGRLAPGGLTPDECEAASTRREQRRRSPLYAPALFSSTPPRVADTSA